MCAVVDLDALARGREARDPGVVLRDVRGDGAVRPGPAVVRGGRHTVGDLLNASNG